MSYLSKINDIRTEVMMILPQAIEEVSEKADEDIRNDVFDPQTICDLLKMVMAIRFTHDDNEILSPPLIKKVFKLYKKFGDNISIGLCIFEGLSEKEKLFLSACLNSHSVGKCRSFLKTLPNKAGASSESEVLRKINSDSYLTQEDIYYTIASKKEELIRYLTAYIISCQPIIYDYDPTIPSAPPQPQSITMQPVNTGIDLPLVRQEMGLY